MLFDVQLMTSVLVQGCQCDMGVPERESWCKGSSMSLVISVMLCEDNGQVTG